MKFIIVLTILTIYCEFNVGLTIPVSRNGEPLYLTPLLEDNITEAIELAEVNLKSSHARKIESYAGFFTVNKKYNSTLFHWYFVAEQEPETAPLLLWLNGGPGSSSLIGLFEENGPFKVNEDIQLESREYYWTKNHHVIYIDSPVGTGFSYTDSEEGYSKNTDDVSKNLHEALEQFFKLWPNLKNNDLYLAGESYAGKYIPNLAHLILCKRKFKNFRGIAIGNGFTDPVIQAKGAAEFLYQQGFLDAATRDLMDEKEQKCSEIIETLTQNKCNCNCNKLEKTENPLQLCRDIIDPFSNNTLFGNATGYGYVYNILHSRPPSEENYLREAYLAKSTVRKSIHVGNLTRYIEHAKVQQHLGVSIFESEKKHVEELLARNYRVLIYSGQLDIIFPYIVTVNYLKTLNFTFIDEYNKAPRFVWKVDDDVAGYIKSAGPLTEVMVIGAGHMVPMDQPKRAWDLITKFTRNKLPKLKKK